MIIVASGDSFQGTTLQPKSFRYLLPRRNRYRLEVTHQGPLPMQIMNLDTMNAPWGLQSRYRLVRIACRFFNVEELAASHKTIGKRLPAGGKPVPLTGDDFVQYLEATGAFEKRPNALRVGQILERMVSAGLLIRAGYGNRSLGGLGDNYLFVEMAWDISRSEFRFVRTLGAEFLYRLCEPGLVHITGTDNDGSAVAETGMVISPFHVLTCRHVISDMRVDARQNFQGRKYAVRQESIHAHSDVDVALIQVDGPPLQPLQGAICQRPVVAQTVYTLGYPKLAGLRDASVTMQQGAVTNEEVTALSGDSLFLFSAISRPGNSGGPVMSEDGYVIGLCTVDARAEYSPDELFSPHYAGIPAQVVVEAVASLGFPLPFENHE